MTSSPMAPSLLALLVSAQPVLPREERRASARAWSGLKASNAGNVWRRERRRVIKGKR